MTTKVGRRASNQGEIIQQLAYIQMGVRNAKDPDELGLLKNAD